MPALVRLLVSAGAAAIVILVGLAVGSSFFSTPTEVQAQPESAPPATPDPAPGLRQGVSDPRALLENERNTIEVFQRADPSVVFVTNNALRRDFFSMNVTEVPQGAGSGFLWDEHGHVVTNYHVLEGGQTFSITLPTGVTREARVVGVEPRKDLAVLHFETDGLEIQPLPIGRSAGLVVGQKVLAIGNPFGLDRTLTTGIISAVGREFPTGGGFVIEDVIQTDASINPGNSGGPLLDSSGNVIGVNTAIYSPSGTSAGISFAIPVDTVRRIVPQLIRYGQVRRVGLGVTVLPDHIVRNWGIAGVGIRDVSPGSEAARAGLRPIRLDRRGRVLSVDILTAVDGEVIDGFATLSNALDGREPGEEVVLSVLRDDQTIPIEMRLQQLGR